MATERLVCESLWTVEARDGVPYHTNLLRSTLPYGLELTVDFYTPPFASPREVWWTFVDEQGHAHTRNHFPQAEVDGTLAYLGAPAGVSPLAATVAASELNLTLTALVEQALNLHSHWLALVAKHGVKSRRAQLGYRTMLRRFHRLCSHASRPVTL